MFSEMTLLTALRTSATSALATDLMARKNAKTLAIIGTGAQSEFQVKGLKLVRDISEVRYFDIDFVAMDKFENNLDDEQIKLVRCKDAKEATVGADVIKVCTASKAHVDVIKNEWVKAGMHINALGGDTVGKTELEQSILQRCKIVVEYFEQSYIEGEIQRLERQEAEGLVFAELHELFNNIKKRRRDDGEITLFDSVGIALEDYSVLRLIYELAKKYKIGEELDITPDIKNAKNLNGVLERRTF